MWLFHLLFQITANVDAMGSLEILAIKSLNLSKKLNLSSKHLKCFKVLEYHRMKKLHFIQEVRMEFQKFFHIGHV